MYPDPIRRVCSCDSVHFLRKAMELPSVLDEIFSTLSAGHSAKSGCRGICLCMKTGPPYTTPQREVLASLPELDPCIRLIEKVVRANIGPETRFVDDMQAIPFNRLWGRTVQLCEFLGPELWVWLHVKCVKLADSLFERYGIRMHILTKHTRLEFYSDATMLGNATECGVELQLGSFSSSESSPDWKKYTAAISASFQSLDAPENREVQRILAARDIDVDGAPYFAQFPFSIVQPTHSRELGIRIPFDNLPAMRRLWSILLLERPLYDRKFSATFFHSRPLLYTTLMVCVNYRQASKDVCNRCGFCHDRFRELQEDRVQCDLLCVKIVKYCETNASSAFHTVNRLHERFRLFVADRPAPKRMFIPSCRT